MSDTDAEWRDHSEAIYRIQRAETRSVLINGLGLGMVVQAALDTDHVERVDVVEKDQRVIDLIGPHYTRDPRVTIHHGDAYTIKWPVGAYWDVAWSDIWLELNADNLDGMATLRRRYARRTGWHDCWGRMLLVAERARWRRQGWW
jgi:predicted membrane-bound spermidine synthase